MIRILEGDAGGFVLAFVGAEGKIFRFWTLRCSVVVAVFEV